MEARLQASRLRGDLQPFKLSTNVIAGWSDCAFIIEHDYSGRLLAETRFRRKRMIAHCSYNFTGISSEPPVVAAFVFGTYLDNSLTVVYVTCNAAMELEVWNFFHAAADRTTFLESSSKTGLETLFEFDGSYSFILAEAVGKNRVPLPYGRSETIKVRLKSKRSRKAAVLNKVEVQEAWAEVFEASKLYEGKHRVYRDTNDEL